MTLEPPVASSAPTDEVEVRRSRRRRRTVSAYRESDGRVVVLVPARFTRAQEREWVDTMVTRLRRSEARRKPSDDKLMARARRLSAKYLEGLARPTSVRWADNQLTRWGSCTPDDATIRLSSRLQGMPAWVVDYVLVHELAHLLEHGHNEHFWALVQRYPRTERARGFLEGVESAARLGMAEDDEADDAQSVLPVPSGPPDPEDAVTAELDELG